MFDKYDDADYYAFDIAAYNSRGSRIAKETVFFEGNAGETISLYATLSLDISDVQKGVTIEFEDYIE